MRVLVIGGGAAGLTAAGSAARAGHEVTVIERNARMARKVMITGKGRCNITNNCSVQEFIAQVPRNGRFLYSTLTAFSPQDTMVWLEELGVPLKTERGNRVFPQSDKAVDIVDALVRYARGAGCHFHQGRAVGLQLDNGECTGVCLESNEKMPADRVIVCTGGLSYPQTGSTGDGYQLAEQAGHTIIPTRPSLVPLTSSDDWCAQLQGLSLKNCRLRLQDTVNHKWVFEDFGEMLFTHFGVSGPMVLSASAHMSGMRPGRYHLSIDLKPALSEEQLDTRLVRELQANANLDVGNMLRGLLPRKMVPVAVRLSALDPSVKCRNITREQRIRLRSLLKNFPVAISGFRPIAEAVVTAGGVCIRDIHSKTMQSKITPGLSFAGEVLDLDAYTGGFNLQIALSTGMAAGLYAAE